MAGDGGVCRRAHPKKLRLIAKSKKVAAEVGRLRLGSTRLIVIRAETAKTREEREVPIPDNLAQWLAPCRNASGPVICDEISHRTTRPRALGRSSAGGSTIALRDSFCSYRARITQNMPQVSYGNGQLDCDGANASYHHRQPIHTAEAWFNMRPKEDSNVVAFSQAVG